MIKEKHNCTDFCSKCLWLNLCGTDEVDYPCFGESSDSPETQYNKYIQDLYEPYESEDRLEENERENDLYYKEILRGGKII